MKKKFLRLLFVLLFVILGTKFILVASDVRKGLEQLSNVERFRSFDVSGEILKKCRKYNQEEQWIDKVALNYCKYNGKIKDDEILLDKNSLYATMLSDEVIEQYKERLQILLGDIQFFPVPIDATRGENVKYENSWGNKRNFGGERNHEGCDIMTTNNEVGYFPVQSVSDGVVEKIGWLELGGYRIGIRAPGGAFFYYAHLDSYADGLEIGSEVKAGETLGKMGNTGYGVEGTTGKFDTHLHFGIYMDVLGKEVSVNPYQILKYIEESRKTFYVNS